MDFKEYQKKALTTALYPRRHKVIYPALGLGNEAGEVLGKIKKWLRDEGGRRMSKERKEKIKDELGDVLWYLAALSQDLGLEMENIAKLNLDKLRSRKIRGKLKGDGNKR